MLILAYGSSFGAEVKYFEKLEGQSITGLRQIEIIEFRGHTYIHYRNLWTSSDSGFIHDPDCECKKNKG